METLKLSDLIEYPCTGFIPLMSGALMNDVDVTFFLKNSATVSNWLSTLIALSTEFGNLPTEYAIREAGIPTVNLDNLIALSNSPVKRPVLDHLSPDEIRELNDMSLTILMYVVEQDNWHPAVRDLVQTLGLDGLEAKVCLHFINEVAQAERGSLTPAQPNEVESVVAKIIQLQKEKQIQEIEFLQLCIKIEEGVWRTNQALNTVQMELLGRTITTTQLLKVNEKIFNLEGEQISDEEELSSDAMEPINEEEELPRENEIEDFAPTKLEEMDAGNKVLKEVKEDEESPGN